MSPYNTIKHRNLFVMRKLDTLLEDVKASQHMIEEGASTLLWRTFFFHSEATIPSASISASSSSFFSWSYRSTLLSLPLCITFHWLKIITKQKKMPPAMLQYTFCRGSAEENITNLGSQKRSRVCNQFQNNLNAQS